MNLGIFHDGETCNHVSIPIKPLTNVVLNKYNLRPLFYPTNVNDLLLFNSLLCENFKFYFNPIIQRVAQHKLLKDAHLSIKNLYERPTCKFRKSYPPSPRNLYTCVMYFLYYILLLGMLAAGQLLHELILFLKVHNL